MLPTQDMTVDEIINLYQGYCSRKGLSDEYLESKNYDTRDDDWNLVSEHEYVNEILRLRSILFNAGIVK